MAGYARIVGSEDPAGEHTNNGGMQETYMELPMAAPDALTVGGNQQIVNGPECDTLDDAVESMAFRSGPLSDEDDSHVQGAWHAQSADFAGS